MLVIGRGESQSLKIGDDITITIEKIYTFNGKPYAKVSIEAPKDLKILRIELDKSEEVKS